MTVLARIIIAFCTAHLGPLWTVYAPQIRHAPEARSQELADQIDDAARMTGRPASRIAAVAATESAFNHAAVSSSGARGMMQLNTLSRYGRMWRHDCLRSPYDCELSNVRWAAIALRDGEESCGSAVKSIGYYRTGHCVDGPRARETLRLAAAIETVLQREQ